MAEYYEEDEELKKLLEKRRAEFEKLAREREKEEAMRAEMEREALLRSILTEEARERLARLKLARPDFVKAIENQLIYLAQTGRISYPINDEQLKDLLRRFSSKKKGGGITIKRKGGV